MTFSKKFQKKCRQSLFISALMVFINAIYDRLRDGLFGRLMTSYTAEENMFRNGIIGDLFSSKGKPAEWLRKIRLYFAELFEKSVLLEYLLKKGNHLLGCSLRLYGVFFATFGVYTGLVYFIKRYALLGAEQSVASLIIGVISFVLSLPMFASGKSVAVLLQKGMLSHLLLIDIFGIAEERFEIAKAAKIPRYNHALFLGMVVGISTFFIPAPRMLIFVLCLIAVTLVMSYPEVGALVMIAILPFYTWLDVSGRFLNLSIALTAIAYLVKLIRGKRIIRFELIDICVLLFGIAIWLGGIASVGGKASLSQSMHTCLLLLIYFLTVNLLRTPVWLHRAVMAVVSAATIVAAIGTFRYLSGREDASWDSILRVSSTFDSPNMFAVYLLLILPLGMAFVMTALHRKHRLAAEYSVLILIFALLSTWSQEIWLGGLIALITFFLIYSRRSAVWLLLSGLTVPVWMLILPSGFLHRMFDIADMADAHVYEQASVWQGTCRMLSEYAFGGVGYGSAAFQEVYPRFSVIGFEQSETAGSLYLSLLASLGVFGLIVFAVLFVVFAQYCLEYIGNASESYSRTFVAAGFSAVIGALATGIRYDIWQDDMVFLTFFLVFALTCSYVKAGTIIRRRNQDVGAEDVSSAHIDLHFDV